MPFSDISQQSLMGSLLTFPIKLLKGLWHLLLAILLFPIRLIQTIFRGLQKVLHWMLPEFFAENLSHAFRLIRALFTILFAGTFFCVIFLGIVHFVTVGGATFIFKDVDVAQALITTGKAIFLTGGLFIALTVGGFLLTSLLVMFGITAYSTSQTLLEKFEILIESRRILIAMFVVAVTIFGVVYAMLSGKLPL